MLLDRLAVDGRHARADHREEPRRRQPVVLDEAREVARLGVGDVDHEVVRRVRRQARAPGLEQVAADDREEQQHHEPEPERDHLHDALAPAPREVRDAIAPGDADRAAQAPGEAHQQVARAVEHGERPADARRDETDEPGVAHQPEQDADERRDGEAIRQGIAQRRRFEVPAQHARRRHALQLQHGRQREADQDRERRRRAEPGRRERRRRQVGADEVPQQARQELLREETKRRADERPRPARPARARSRSPATRGAAAHPCTS